MYKKRVQGFLRLTRDKNRTRMTTASGQVITAGDRQVLINYRINCELGAERPVPPRRRLRNPIILAMFQ